MSADLAARLRALAQDHHAGKLSLATYRKLRGPLLDSLALHACAMDEMAVTQPRSLGRAASSPPKIESAPVAAPPKTSKLPRVAVALSALMVIAVAAWWGLQRSPPEESSVTNATAPSSPVHDVVTSFVQRGDWSDARVAALNVALLELGERQIAMVASERWFKRFVDDLSNRFKEQQALVQKPLTSQSSPLAALAVTVGLDLNSPDAAIRITSIDAVSAPVTSESPSSVPPVTAAEVDSRAPRAARDDVEASPPKAKSKSVAAAKEATVSSPVTEATPRPSNCRRELIRSRRPFCNDTLASGRSGPQLALIPAGEFEMGSTAAASEQPIHRVKIVEPFALSVHEISQAEYQAYCDDTGRPCATQPWTGDDYPVVNVSWEDARAYVEWLSRATGYQYRLPTEAQWEYAARAGQAGLVPGGDTLSPTDAHFSMRTTQTAPAPRSQKFNDNAFRLLHTLGNVREWVEDTWVENYDGAPSDGAAITTSMNNKRVARGGSFADGATKLRLSVREGLAADTRDALTGFRVLREVP